MNLDTLRKLEAALKEADSDFEIRWKTDSLLMKAIGLFVRPFNSKFMTSYATTIGSKVYFPSAETYEDDPEHRVRTLAHEFVHIWDGRLLGWRYVACYLAPQIFALPLLLGALVASSWLFLAVGLACLAPWPSQGRTHFELRGYAMTLAVYVWTRGRLPSQKSINSCVEKFTKSSYWWMCRDRAKVETFLVKASHDALSGSLQISEPYKTIYDFLRTHGQARI